MKRSEQQMHLVMDESDAPYGDGQYTRTLEDDLSIIRLAKKYNLEFIPESRLAKLSRTMDGDA